jgi:peptidyl-prolyl cis-trans isomerase SurA
MRFVSVLILAGLLSHCAFAEKMVSDGVAAIVNDSIITYYDVQKSIQDRVNFYANQYAREPEKFGQKLSELRAQATEFLIERQLILQDYKAAGYNYPESVIEDEIQRRIKEMFRDRTTLIQTLHEEGLTYETWRRDRREDILIVAMQQLKAPRDVLVSPQKILDFYGTNKTNFAVGEQVKLRTIMLNKPAGDKGEVRQLAEEILRKINEGAAFAEMARIHTDDGALKASGGDTGWVQTNSIRKELSDVAFSLKPGEKSSIIDLPESCWLLFVEDRKPAHVKPIAEVREEIERTLRSAEAARLQQKWIKRLRDKAFVVYF